MGVKLVSTSGGSVEVNPPATASNFTQTLVPVTGTLAPLVSDTAKASTSGTSIDFTGIPSWVKRITVMFQGMSTNGTSQRIVQLGTSGGVVTSGYLGSTSLIGSSVLTTAITAGFGMYNGSAAETISGQMVLTNISGNAWIGSVVVKGSGPNTMTGGGDITLGGTLDRIRITTVNGTDTFDAGSINILYE
jgi:hypothetical protein